MKLKTLIAAMLLTATAAIAQNDPVIMTINGQPVLRSEFEYSYNKNNAEGVIDKKSVEEYVELFVNYKLKVVAAIDAKLDTLTSFKLEFQQYRDQQVRPTLITDADVEAEAHKIYDQTVKTIGPRGLVKPAHILMYVPQRDSEDLFAAAKVRIDSIYGVLKSVSDTAALAKAFADMAVKLSQDPGTAPKGGELPWVSPNQTFKEFETVAYSLQSGQMSEPFSSPAGWHIILMKGRKQFEPYEFHRESILKFIEARNLRERIINDKIDAIAKTPVAKLSREEVMQQRADSLAAVDPDMKNLIREYYDGLLLYEISNRTVWNKAAKDEAGLEKFFKKNKKNYTWERPRFKGMAYHTRVQEDIPAVADCVKKLAFDKWADALRTTFNSDSILRIRVEKGIFKQGDNALVDREAFKVDTVAEPKKDFPFSATYGKLITKPENYADVRGLVTADYQEALEKEWVAELRRKYSVVVDEKVLATVNKH